MNQDDIAKVLKEKMESGDSHTLKTLLEQCKAPKKAQQKAIQAKRVVTLTIKYPCLLCSWVSTRVEETIATNTYSKSISQTIPVSCCYMCEDWLSVLSKTQLISILLDKKKDYPTPLMEYKTTYHEEEYYEKEL